MLLATAAAGGRRAWVAWKPWTASWCTGEPSTRTEPLPAERTAGSPATAVAATAALTAERSRAARLISASGDRSGDACSRHTSPRRLLLRLVEEHPLVVATAPVVQANRLLF